MHHLWHAFKFLDRLKCESEVKTTKEQGVGACFLTYNTLGVEGRTRIPGWDYKEWQALTHSHGPTQNQTTSWLMHSWSTFGVRTNHGQT